MTRKTFIVRPRLQLKYLIFSLLVVCFTALSVYYVFWSTLITSPGMEMLSSGEVRALQFAYQTNFIWVVLIIIVAIGFVSIFYFHRLVGPIFLFGNVVKTLATGDLSVATHSRKKDELKDMSIHLQYMIENMRQAVIDDRERIERIKQSLEKNDTATAKEYLAQLSSWYKI
ncbi:MAG: methyl-accepting chemotaxis protein [Endomicrobiales bacterium]